jgi:cold shock protein
LGKLPGKTEAVSRGTVRQFSEEKGYGFIEPDDGREEILVHYTEVERDGFRSLVEGERVSYEPVRIIRGSREREEAKDVHRVDTRVRGRVVL